MCTLAESVLTGPSLRPQSGKRSGKRRLVFRKTSPRCSSLLEPLCFWMDPLFLGSGNILFRWQTVSLCRLWNVFTGQFEPEENVATKENTGSSWGVEAEGLNRDARLLKAVCVEMTSDFKMYNNEIKSNFLTDKLDHQELQGSIEQKIFKSHPSPKPFSKP